MGTNAQILNPSFEDWSNGEPVNWSTNNSTGSGAVVQSNDSQNGNSAVQLNVVNNNGGSNLLGGSVYNTYSETSLNNSISFWYKGNLQSGDQLSFSAGINDSSNSTTLAYVVPPTFVVTSVYQNYTANFIPTGAIGQAANGLITLTILNNGGLPVSINSNVIIDNFELVNNTSGIKEMSEKNNSFIESIKPNPAIGSFSNLIYFHKNDGNVSLKIFDALGKEVLTLFNEIQPKGKFKAEIPTHLLESGLYMAVLNFDGEIKSVRFLK